MVPVMTLAVCFIAMVGLGFALATSVTSSTNDLEKLMIDLDSDYDNINGQYAPDDTDVNSLFDYRIITGKTSDTNAGTITIKYKLDSKESYLKVFSNVGGKKATLKVSGDGLAESDTTTAGSITKVVLGLYSVNVSVNGESVTETHSLMATAEVSKGSDNAFESSPATTGGFKVNANTIYMVKIDKITIDGITYVSGDSGITITKSGSDYTYKDGTSQKTVDGFPKFNANVFASLGFTFTAYAEPTV